MSLIISEWRRQDHANCGSFGRAVLRDSDLLRAQSGVRDSWFYWIDADTVGIVAATESGTPLAGLGRAAQEASVTSGLAELARRTGLEAWGAGTNPHQ